MIRPLRGASATFKAGPHGAPNMAYEALDFFDVDGRGKLSAADVRARRASS